MTVDDSKLDDRVDDDQLPDDQLPDSQYDDLATDLDYDGRLVDPDVGAMEPDGGQVYNSDLDYEPENSPKLRRQHLVGSVLVARLASAGLWLLVIGAVVLAALALIASRSAQAPAAAPEGDIAAAGDSAQRAAGFAQMAVRQYIGEAGQGTEDVMASLLAGEQPSLEGVTPAGFYVVDATAVDLEDIGGGYWAVTVAAELMAAVDGRYEPSGVRYYSVGVLVDDATGGAVLADVPSQVPPPPGVESPGLLAEPLGAPDDSEQLATVREFLGALLLGEGPIRRFTAPGADIPAIDPPPFTVFEIDGATVTTPEADATAVRVSLLAADDRGLAQRLHYTLGMRKRDGRWEIAELFRAPLLSDESYPLPDS
jgi:hypothetical protein